MGFYPKAIERLVTELGKLPGIGEKTAQRLAFHLIDASAEEIEVLSNALLNVKDKIKLCPECFSITDGDRCDVCADPNRNRKVICVVQSTKDIFAIEKTREYNGLYHVLHGLISPMDGVGAEQLCIKELLARLQNGDVKEIIMQTNPTVEAEAPAMYVARLVKPLGVRATRLAYGLPVGSNLEYADEVTLGRSLANRGEL